MSRTRIATLVVLALSGSLVYLCFFRAKPWSPHRPIYFVGRSITTREELDRVESHPPPASFAIEPASGKVKVYKRIRCTVRIKVPEGNPGPSFVNAILRARGLDYWRGALEVTRHEGDDYVLEGTIRAPSKPGKYRLLFELLYPFGDAILEGTSPSPNSAASRAFHHDIEGIKIEVYR